jgi:hypothetical protein
MAEIKKFELVEEADAGPVPPTQESNPGLDILLLSLQALSKRTIVALSNLFCLLTVGSSFWLCLSIHDPNPLQLVEIGGYFAFVLAANWIVRR